MRKVEVWEVDGEFFKIEEQARRAEGRNKLSNTDLDDNYMYGEWRFNSVCDIEKWLEEHKLDVLDMMGWEEKRKNPPEPPTPPESRVIKDERLV